MNTHLALRYLERRFGKSYPRPLISRSSTIAGALRFGWGSRTEAMSTSSNWRMVQSWHDQFDGKSKASAGMKERWTWSQERPGILAPEKWWRDDGTSHELWWRGHAVQPKTAGHAFEGVSNTQNDVGHDLSSCAQERTAQSSPEPRRGSQLHQIQQHRISSQRQRQHRQVESTRTWWGQRRSSRQ